MIEVWTTRSPIHPHSCFPRAFLSAGRPQWHSQVHLSPELLPNWDLARLLACQRRRQRGTPQPSKLDSLRQQQAEELGQGAHVCVCVCVMVSSGSEGYSISVGPVMRLVHPLTSPFAASPLRVDLGQARFLPLPVLGILTGTNVSLVVPVPTSSVTWNS